MDAAIPSRLAGGKTSVPGRSVLLVEDDAAIVSALSTLLAAEGFQVSSSPTQAGAIALLGERPFDIALLDVTLAEGNGFAVCMAAREAYPSMPVIFLTASDDEYSTVAGLDMGAVDYISKPFRPRELVSRIHAALRQATPGAMVFKAADVHFDATAATVTKGGRGVDLTALEYRLLLHLMQRKGQVVTREALKDTIWESAGEYVSDNALNVYIKRLREKVEDDPSDPKVIVTVRGMGYRVCG